MSCELLAPAGSPESMRAAVANGADAIYFGSGLFNARRGAKNFTQDDLSDAVRFCRLRGVKTYVTFNILMSDRELVDGAREVEKFTKAGVDALIVQDLGAARMIREVSPSMPIHASTQLSVHSLDGVRAAASLGIERVILARELPKSDIEYICKNSPIGIEIFLHGALCMCYSGQCYMSGIIGQRSGNRGLCAQPCRLDYNGEYPLSLKDLSLAAHLTELQEIGVSSLKIEGRMKRPEYVAIVTGVYSAALREGRNPTSAEVGMMKKVFSRSGFTDGYYTENKGKNMFGVRSPDSADLDKLMAKARESYRTEPDLIPLDMELTAVADSRMRLKFTDDKGNTYTAGTNAPKRGNTRFTTEEELRVSLSKLGGTPFAVREQKIELGEGLMIPKSVINSLRRSCVEGISRIRTETPKREIREYNPGPRQPENRGSPVIYVELSSLSQLSEQLLKLKPGMLYIPLEEAYSSQDRIKDILSRGISLSYVLPRIIARRDEGQVIKMLNALSMLYCDTVLCGNIGHIMLAHKAEYRVRGDFGLNAYNSQSLKVLRSFGCESATLSFELSKAQIRDISKGMETELIAYGRLPLMIFENCVVSIASGGCGRDCERQFTLTDRTGAKFPVVRAFGCRNELLNSKKLYLADTPDIYRNIGISAIRLKFTTENASECVSVVEAYSGRGGVTPNDLTRGLYKRGVQ
ncbi:MAG: U32 family peptidase [Clostridiales bacterium]|nr:U32 family peptidase [Clostridiales bacterium]